MIKRISRAPSSTGGGLCLAALAGLMLLLVLTAYYPFRWDPPRVVHNEVTRGGGALRFGEMNRARTQGTPDWLSDARRSGNLRIDLQIDPQPSQEQSPASIMMLARDFWHGDFAIGQDHSELLVWLRRPGSDANGNPPFAINGALHAARWNRIQVLVRDDRLRIDVNGGSRLTERLPPDSLSTWGAGQIALGDEVHGGGPWQGRIRQAEVHTPGVAVDYTRPGALSIPARYLYLPDHVAPFPPEGRGEWEALVLHGASFLAVGFLIASARRPPVRVVPATALAALFAVALGAGKLLFHGRHTEATDIVVQTLGALLGAFLARRWSQSRPQAEPAPDDLAEPASDR
jgi:hypothetical protein